MSDSEINVKFGVMYRALAGWKLAPYPLRSTPGAVARQIEWLKQKDKNFKTVPLQIVMITPVSEKV